MTPAQTTKTALLEAAKQLFVERGYENVSTRDIALAAKANLASIPYYFGSKAELFVETVKCALGTDEEMHQLRAAPIEGEPPEKALKAFIANFVGELLDPNEQCICWVMFREILNRAPDTKKMREELVEFFHEKFTSVISATLIRLIQLINPKISDDKAKQCSDSVIALCIFYSTHEAFLEYDLKASIRTEPQIALAASHVFDFSLAAIKNLGDIEKV